MSQSIFYSHVGKKPLLLGAFKVIQKIFNIMLISDGFREGFFFFGGGGGEEEGEGSLGPRYFVFIGKLNKNHVKCGK